MANLPIFQLPRKLEGDKGVFVETIGLLVPITAGNRSCHALWVSFPFVWKEGVVKAYEPVHRGVGFQCGYYNTDQNSFQPNHRNGASLSPEVRKAIEDSLDYFSYVQWYCGQGFSDSLPTYQQWMTIKTISVSDDDKVSPVEILREYPEIVDPVPF